MKLALAFLLLGTGWARGAPLNEAGNLGQRPASECYLVHGTVALSADIGLVLFRKGERGVVVRNAPGSTHDVPPRLADALMSSPAYAVRGDFMACPIPELPSQFDKGWVHYVTIVSFSHLVILKER